jgi:hypothetical protein
MRPDWQVGSLLTTTLPIITIISGDPKWPTSFAIQADRTPYWSHRFLKSATMEELVLLLKKKNDPQPSIILYSSKPQVKHLLSTGFNHLIKMIFYFEILTWIIKLTSFLISPLHDSPMIKQDFIVSSTPKWELVYFSRREALFSCFFLGRVLTISAKIMETNSFNLLIWRDSTRRFNWFTMW